MRGKKGQFYILAAIIIISVLVGIFLIRNYATPRKSSVKIYDLGEELKIETGSVYDYGIYNNVNTDILIENWTGKYYEYSSMAGNIENWIFVYGDDEEINILYFTKESTGSVCINLFGGNTCIELIGTSRGSETIANPQGKVEITFKGIPYKFELKEGENFFFVISSEEEVIER